MVTFSLAYIFHLPINTNYNIQHSAYPSNTRFSFSFFFLLLLFLFILFFLWFLLCLLLLLLLLKQLELCIFLSDPGFVHVFLRATPRSFILLLILKSRLHVLGSNQKAGYKSSSLSNSTSLKADFPSELPN